MNSQLPPATLHFQRYRAAYEAMETASAKGDLQSAGVAALEAVRQALLGLLEQKTIPHAPDVGFIEASQALAKHMGTPCLPSKVASVLLLGADVGSSSQELSRRRNLISTASDIASTLASMLDPKSAPKP
ncbi:MAG: hypothetical protein ACP5VF_01320 [Acidobacteriota bacterium]